MAVVGLPCITYSRRHLDSRREGKAMSYGTTVRNELQVPTRELRHAIPWVYAGYKELHDSALAPGALDAKTKAAHRAGHRGQQGMRRLHRRPRPRRRMARRNPAGGRRGDRRRRS